MPEPAAHAKTRQTVTPYLVVKDAARALRFYQQAFGATELYRLTEPGGKVGHAEITIGETRLMLADEYPDFGALSAVTIGGSPVKMHVAVANADAAVKRAVDAGATLVRAVNDEFYGERSGMVIDPFGLSWFLSQHLRDVTPEQMQRNFTEVMKSSKP